MKLTDCQPSSDGQLLSAAQCKKGKLYWSKGKVNLYLRSNFGMIHLKSGELYSDLEYGDSMYYLAPINHQFIIEND